MKLQKEEPSSVRLAEVLALRQEGASVVATLAISGDQVMALMKADAARERQKKAERE